jgi:hypothetical protein
VNICEVVLWGRGADEEAEASSSSAGAKAGKALADAAVTGLYTGLKFTGLAVRVASGLAASIGKDTEKALSKVEAAQRGQPVSPSYARPATIQSYSLLCWQRILTRDPVRDVSISLKLCMLGGH